MAEGRIPVRPEWATVARRGDILVVGLAENDNVAKVAEALQSALTPAGVKVVVVDNVQQMLIARPQAETDRLREVTADDVPR